MGQLSVTQGGFKRRVLGLLGISLGLSFWEKGRSFPAGAQLFSAILQILLFCGGRGSNLIVPTRQYNAFRHCNHESKGQICCPCFVFRVHCVKGNHHQRAHRCRGSVDGRNPLRTTVNETMVETKRLSAFMLGNRIIPFSAKLDGLRNHLQSGNRFSMKLGRTILPLGTVEAVLDLTPSLLIKFDHLKG